MSKNQEVQSMNKLRSRIDELDIDLSKSRLKNKVRELYTEAQDLEI